MATSTGASRNQMWPEVVVASYADNRFLPTMGQDGVDGGDFDETPVIDCGKKIEAFVAVIGPVAIPVDVGGFADRPALNVANLTVMVSYGAKSNAFGSNGSSLTNFRGLDISSGGDKDTITDDEESQYNCAPELFAVCQRINKEAKATFVASTDTGKSEKLQRSIDRISTLIVDLMSYVGPKHKRGNQNVLPGQVKDVGFTNFQARPLCAARIHRHPDCGAANGWTIRPDCNQF